MQKELKDSMRRMIEFTVDQGMSIIPIVPGTKTPAVEWKIYQKRKATYAEIEQWFFAYLAKGSFMLQLGDFMVHYFRRKLEEKWFDKKTREWINKRSQVLYGEPWIYSKWHDDFPSTAKEFFNLLLSAHFNDFVKSHLEKNFLWGWTKLFAKTKPELIYLIQLAAWTKQYGKAKDRREAIKACRNLLEQTKKHWFAGYPEELKREIADSTTIGNVAFEWLVSADKGEKMTASDVAGILNLNVVTCKRTAMPKIKRVKQLLKRYGVKLDPRI